MKIKDQREWDNQVFKDLNETQSDLADFSFEECVFENCDFLDGNWRNASFINCKFRNCNLTFNTYYFTRTINSKKSK